MHPARSKTEQYISANWLAAQLGFSRGGIQYHAVQQQLRFFKFSGVRYIEKEDAERLIEALADRFPSMDKQDALEKIGEYHQH
jgi:adenosylmethionine-8-amino-7-oxononanoate aminotransferase